MAFLLCYTDNMKSWEEFLTETGNLIESREKYQRKLGQIAAEVAKQFGAERLPLLADEVASAYGVTCSANTLRNYRWVWEKTCTLDLPEDLSYRTLQTIASSGKAEYWAKRIKDEGLSSSEVYRLIRADRGLDQKEPRTIVCPHCGGSLEI